MRLVSNQSEDEVRFKKARDQLTWPLRDLTANLLRIARGAGRPEALKQQLEACLDVLVAFEQAHGIASAHVIRHEILDPDEAWRAARPRVEEGRQYPNYADEEAERDDALRTIRRGSLQAVASMLLNQQPQYSTGENEMYDGISRLERVRAARRARYRKISRAVLDQKLKVLKKSKKKDKPPGDILSVSASGASHRGGGTSIKQAD
jgi:hypothetical protein